MAALGGAGRLLAKASIALDLHDFEPFKAQSTSVELLDKEEKVRKSPCQSICRLLPYLMQSCLGSGRHIGMSRLWRYHTCR